MYVTQITGPLVSNQPISLSSNPILATNNNISLNTAQNGMIINRPGVYKVRLQANLQSTGTEIGAVLYTDGNIVNATSVSITLANQDDGEIVVEYPVVVKSAPAGNQAIVQFYALAAATVNSGYVSIERIS